MDGEKNKLPNPLNCPLKFFSFFFVSVIVWDASAVSALKMQTLLDKVHTYMKDVHKIKIVSIISIIATLLDVPK